MVEDFLSKPCIGYECEVAKSCVHYVKDRKVSDNMFMSPVAGKCCPYFISRFDDDHDND